MVSRWWPHRLAVADERWAAGSLLALTALLLWAQPLPGGPRLPLALLLVVAFWVCWRYRRAVVTPAGLRAAALFGGLALLVAVSLAGKPFAGSGWGYAFGLAGLAVAGVAVAWAVGRFPSGMTFLTRAAALFWGFLLGDALLQWLVGRDLFGVPYAPEHFEGRLLGPFAESLKMPVLVALLFPLAAWPWRQQPLVVVLLFALSAWVVLLSGARSAFLLLVLAALPLLGQLPKRWWVALLVLGSALVALAVAVTPPLQTRVKAMAEHGWQALVCAQATACADARNAVSTYRWELWRNAWRMVEQYPWFGVGAKRFEAAYPEVADSTDVFVHSRPYHSHNLYTEIAAELGLVGLVGFLLGVGLLLFWYRTATPDGRAVAAPWGAALAAYLWPLQSQPVLLTLWWLPVLFVLVVGFLTALTSGSGEVSRPDGRRTVVCCPDRPEVPAVVGVSSLR